MAAAERSGRGSFLHVFGLQIGDELIDLDFFVFDLEAIGQMENVVEGEVRFVENAADLLSFAHVKNGIQAAPDPGWTYRR
jgi:hypothetical protein